MKNHKIWSSNKTNLWKWFGEIFSRTSWYFLTGAIFSVNDCFLTNCAHFWWDDCMFLFFAENQYVRVLWTFNLDHDDGSTSADGKTNQFPSWFRRGIFCIAKCSCQKAYRSKNKFRIHPKFFSWNRRTQQKRQNLVKVPTLYRTVHC